MSKRKNNNFVLWVACGAVAVLPMIAIFILASPVISEYITKSLEISKETFLGLSLDYLSIFITLGLGVVVYLQSEKINSLEATQYDVFLGIEDVDYDYDFGNYFAVEDNNAEFHIAHIFTSSRKALFSSIGVGHGRGKSLLLPLTFVTKNNPLIVSLYFKKVKIVTKENQRKICDRTYENAGKEIKTILGDESRFVYGFGLIVPENSNINEIQLEFEVELQDQNGYIQTLQPSVWLHRVREKDDFILTSSTTNILQSYK